MATNKSPVFLDVIKSPGLEIENSDGTGEQTLVTAGTDGAIVQSVTVTSDDTSDRDLQVFVNDGVTSHLIGTVNIPTLAGTDGIVPNVNLLQTLNGLQEDGSLILQASHVLKIAALVAVTAAKKVVLVSQGGDF